MTIIPATTVARVRLLLVKSGAEDDVLLTSMIAAVTLDIEAFLGYPISKEVRTEEYTPDLNGHYVFLRVLPVDGITEVRVDTSWVFGSNSIVPADFYRLDREVGAVFFTSELPEGFRTVRVTYLAGIATSTTDLINVAPDIAMAADLQVAEEWRRKNDPGSTGRQGPRGGHSWSGELRMLQIVKDRLTPRRRLTVGSM